MSFILDTCVVSELSKPLPEPRVTSWLDGCPAELLYLSVLTLGELHYGISRLPEGKKKNDLLVWIEHLKSAYRGYILPVDDRISMRWGEERARLERLGQPAPVIDSLLAATALECDFVLVTRNTDNFKSFAIKVFDPWATEEA